MRPVLVTRLERLLDQQAAESRAIDEEVPFDDLTVFQRDGFHETGFRIQGRIFDQALDSLDAASLGKLSQVLAVLDRIDVVGVVHEG